jgi:hypothetical protein
MGRWLRCYSQPRQGPPPQHQAQELQGSGRHGGIPHPALDRDFAHPVREPLRSPACSGNGTHALNIRPGSEGRMGSANSIPGSAIPTS